MVPSAFARRMDMYVPLIYCVIVMWVMVFNPKIIELIPVGSLGMKQLMFAFCAVTVWAMLSLHALASDRN